MTDAPELIWADQDNLTWVEANPNEAMKDCEAVYVRSDLCASGQQVRALEWREDDGRHFAGTYYGRAYEIAHFDVDGWSLNITGATTWKACGSLAAAKQASQDDFRDHILAALTLAPGVIAKGLSDDTTGLCRFGHHPDPAIDFCIEVEMLDSRLHQAEHGLCKPGDQPETVEAVLPDIQKAMLFAVGGDEGAVRAKMLLRDLAKRALTPAQQPGGQAQRLSEAIRQACDLLAERSYGSPARSPAHNARLVLEAALAHATPTAQEAVPDRLLKEALFASIEPNLSSPLYCGVAVTAMTQACAGVFYVPRDWTREQIKDWLGNPQGFAHPPQPSEAVPDSGLTVEQVQKAWTEERDRLTAENNRLEMQCFAQGKLISDLQIKIDSQPSETVAEAATHALGACRIIDAAVLEGHDNVSDLICHLLEAVEPARAALRALKGGDANG